MTTNSENKTGQFGFEIRCTDNETCTAWRRQEIANTTAMMRIFGPKRESFGHMAGGKYSLVHVKWRVWSLRMTVLKHVPLYTASSYWLGQNERTRFEF